MLSWPGEGGRGKEDKWAADQRESSLSAMAVSLPLLKECDYNLALIGGLGHHWNSGLDKVS